MFHDQHPSEDDPNEEPSIETLDSSNKHDDSN